MLVYEVHVTPTFTHGPYDGVLVLYYVGYGDMCDM
jgi:hypothetical protein